MSHIETIHQRLCYHLEAVPKELYYLCYQCQDEASLKANLNNYIGANHQGVWLSM